MLTDGNFYSGQADAYDDFRKRLLQGREELYAKIAENRSGTWVDLGGDGANLEFIGRRFLSSTRVRGRSSELVAQGRDKRAAERGWSQVRAVTADATQWQPEEGLVDIVTFSYSLTMIPDWFAAIDNAIRMLKPGGVVGVVDFYVSRKHPADKLKRHAWSTRSFWPIWFAGDNVFPNPDHIPYLQRKLNTLLLNENDRRYPICH